MTDMMQAIVPKSDQLNSDDLIGGPRTIRISSVSIKSAPEQPVSIHFDGDNGKPYKPCKSMSRVLVAAWGADAKKYVGRSLTLYRDPSVKWAGLEVGGIRISHMTDIEAPLVLALTATRGSRKPHTVTPLKVSVQETTASAVALKPIDYEACQDQRAFDALEGRRKELWASLAPADKAHLKAASDAAAKRLSAATL